MTHLRDCHLDTYTFLPEPVASSSCDLGSLVSSPFLSGAADLGGPADGGGMTDGQHWALASNGQTTGPRMSVS